MRVRTLALYLIGNRQAILDLAADRRGLWVGLLFVLSAGFAREYDGVDLLREPWHLLVPLGASLAASMLLFLVACGRLFFRREDRPPFFTAYRAFLTLFWMTAPLAWLYAIPYERLLPPGEATLANLWTLALVAAWRVAIMVRVVSVLTGRSVLSAVWLVMAFANAAALAAVYLMPKPVVSFMGGVRLTESEQAIQAATFFVSCLGIVSAPVWLIGGVVTFFTGRPVWNVAARPTETNSAFRGMWILAALSLAVWLPILPSTQAEQQLRSQVEVDMKAGRIADALGVMTANERSDFPPHWDPPPRVGYGEKTPHLLVVLEVLVARDDAPWVRASYVDKLRRHLGTQEGFYFYPTNELGPLARILKQLPEGPGIMKEHRQALKSRLSDNSLPAAERANLTALLIVAEKEPPPNR